MASKRKWTDEQLREAIRLSTTWFAAIRKLGLSGRGGNHYSVKRRVLELGIDVSHFTSLPNDSATPWTEDQLRTAVAESVNYPMTLTKLGLIPSGALEMKVRRRVRSLGISTQHFSRVTGERRRYKPRWTDDELRAAVAASTSYAQTIRSLGLVAAGGNYDQVQRRIKELALDTSHFTGAAWNTGKKFVVPLIPLEDLLVKDRWVGSHGLKERLFRERIKTRRCELCHWAEVALDGRIPVELDHINGDKLDNRLENLRILCPNCHALQPTHRGLNKKSRRASSDR